MPVTFNPNNNYNVEIVEEPVANGPNPSFSIKYSTGNIPGIPYNLPFVEMKITPTNPQTRPVLACNLEFDELLIERITGNNNRSSFTHNSYYQSLGVLPCDPPLPPYTVNSNLNVVSSLEHFHSIYRSQFNCATVMGGASPPNFLGNSFTPQQGPYLIDYPSQVTNDQVGDHGVGIKKIVFIEVYEDDNGDLVNDHFSPEIEGHSEAWAMWSSKLGPSITNKVYPVFIKAFVFLDTSFLTLITTNITLFIDIDETEPTYGCNDSSALNYQPAATIGNGSCLYAPTPNNVIIKDVGNTIIPSQCAYIDPPFPSEVISIPQLGLTTQDLSTLPVMPKNLATSQKTIVVNSQTVIPSMTLSNTYFAGDHVNELVHVKLFPRQKILNTFYNLQGVTTPILTKALAVFDFPLPGGPHTNYQASLPAADPSQWMGQALNNLTGAGVSILNNGVANNGRPNYIPAGSTSGFSPVQAEQAQWWPAPAVDINGNMPTTILTWDTPNNSIECVQPGAGGGVFNVGVEGIWAEEFYVSNTSGQVSDFTGLEWFPQRIDLYVKLDFTMPNHEVVVNLDLQHNNLFINWI